MNIRMEYLYRDAANYKQWGRITFRNPRGLTAEDVTELVQSVLIDGEYFVAEKARIPVLYFTDRDSELDHEWHEFHSFESTMNMPDDSLSRSVEELVESLRAGILCYEIAS